MIGWTFYRASDGAFLRSITAPDIDQMLLNHDPETEVACEGVHDEETRLVDDEIVAAAPNQARLLADLRNERDLRLTRCDWTQVPDNGLPAAEVAAWRLYRQALRDLPETADPSNPIWPVAPSSEDHS
ncbi:phage tail assembly chaperone [Paracoccus sp. 11-3]|uniref:Phage tail assembly chaperone n=1 Tax=Paracoccus amoyensis TaxID=2760093 RepID=A0A926GEB5_9RHOB|nr:tail fiber assembly protein [Paracoccus amoyensis]MBC9246752.1 phage tail assembly chaperone [Paracoccus amoyensis]